MKFFNLLTSLLAIPPAPDQALLAEPKGRLGDKTKGSIPKPLGPPETPYILTTLQQRGRTRPEIKLLDLDGKIKWAWGTGPETREKRLPIRLRWCLSVGPNSSEMKWAKNGTKIAGLVGRAAVVIHYEPDNPRRDKRIVYGVCLGGMLASSHTLEPLPDKHLAIATTGQTPLDGFWIYNAGEGLVDKPQPVQIITKFPAIHAMIWDEKEQILWAVGNDKAANGREGPSRGLLNGYKRSKPGADTFLDPKPAYSYLMDESRQCDVEWGRKTADGQYWDGPHDLVPLPNQRKFLITTDLDVQTFDLEQERWRCCDNVVNEYLKGFEPVGERVGINREGQSEILPRSDIKSVSLTADGRSALYNQAVWKTYLGQHINVLVDGKKIANVDPGPGGIYRARWFAGVPGWPGAW
jgi:hypothetical protein